MKGPWLTLSDSVFAKDCGVVSETKGNGQEPWLKMTTLTPLATRDLGGDLQYTQTRMHGGRQPNASSNEGNGVVS